MVMNELHVANGVQIVRDVLLKPRSPFTSSSLDAASPHPYLKTLVPLTIFDLATHDGHPAILYTFRAPTPDNQAMADALALTLYHYPMLAGSFTTDDAGWPCVVLDDHGVRLVETRVDTHLDAHLPFEPASNFVASLVPPVLAVRELCQVQLNHFSCGGLALGFTSHQQVADGRAVGTFVVAWAETARAASKDHHLDSKWELLLQDRYKLNAPAGIPVCMFRHKDTEFISTSKDKKKNLDLVSVEASIATMVNVSVHYSKDFIARLKAAVLTYDGDCPSPPNTRCSTFQIVLAHIWKNLTAARRLSPEVTTRVRVAVDGRTRLRDPVIPASYFGNMVLWAFPTMTAGDLLAASYSKVVGVIREAVRKLDDSYFRSFIHFGELLKRGKLQSAEDVRELVPSVPLTGDILCPDMEVDSWLGLDLHKMDIGGCRPCGMISTGLPIEGLSLFLPSSVEDGGVDVIVALKREHAPLFEELCGR